MDFHWIDPEEYSFNSFLLMERFQIRLMLEYGGWGCDREEWNRSLGIALGAHPAVKWYFLHRCPGCEKIVREITANAPENVDSQQIRQAERFVLQGVEDFVIYTTPEKMAKRCDFIRGWHKERLFALADLTGKTVLDIGAGSGRLTFAAAEKAAWVYAVEPVETLREFMRQKAVQDGIRNVRITDGFVADIPYPDNTFDGVMSGHVVGDDWDAEIAELSRVCRPGGWLLDCPGDSLGNIPPSEELHKRGWEEIHYTGSFGKSVYQYRKQVHTY